METHLARIAKIAKEKPNEKFTSLSHLLNVPLFYECHRQLAGNKAVGVDGVTKKEYEEDLIGNLTRLHERMRTFSYRHQPVRRVEIPKDGSSKMRPLGIPSYEDKIVQSAMKAVLETIYEQDFLPFSFGFRPGRGCHEAIAELGYILENLKVSYVVDADIRGFFDNVNHEWLMKFVEHRVKDPKFLRHLKRLLKAGIMEKDVFYLSEKGTPQGGVISPLLANIYLHYVLDLWFEKRVKKQCRGEAYIVRYADDFVCCFQYKSDAQAFYQTLKERIGQFGLEVAEEKTKIIAFGRFAGEEARSKGQRVGTFDFLGFTHYCGKSRDGMRFRVKRKTSKKKRKASASKIKQWIQKHRHLSFKELVSKLNRKLRGYYNYYGITDNSKAIQAMRCYIIRTLYWVLRRRSNRNPLTWEKYLRWLKNTPLILARVTVNIYHKRLRTDY